MERIGKLTEQIIVAVLAGVLSLVAGSSAAYITTKAQFSNWQAQNEQMVQQDIVRDARAAAFQKDLVSLENKLTDDREKELETIRAQREKELESSRIEQSKLEHKRQFAYEGQALIDVINHLVTDFQESTLDFEMSEIRESNEILSLKQFPEQLEANIKAIYQIRDKYHDDIQAISEKNKHKITERIDSLTGDFNRSIEQFNDKTDAIVKEANGAMAQIKAEDAADDVVQNRFNEQFYKCKAEFRRLENSVKLHFDDSVMSQFTVLRSAIDVLGTAAVKNSRGSEYKKAVEAAQLLVNTDLQVFQNLAYKSVSKNLLGYEN